LKDIILIKTIETMTNEVTIVNFTEDQVKLIKSQIAPKATNDELQLFLYQAKRTGLDPLTRQIYAIHRNVKEKEYGRDVWKQKMSIQTSIDGFRVIAERSGDYAGQDEPVFIEKDGKLISCKITVYRFRGDTRYPAAVGVAYWTEYCQTDNQGNPTPMWKRMPHTMLAKVAEALALRKAYPQDLSGLYTGDEMTQADEPQADEPKEPVDVKPNFFKEPTGAMANIANGASEDMKLKAEEKRLNDLKTSLASMGSVAEIDGYLEGAQTTKGNTKTRMQILKTMSEVNVSQALLIIKNAKLAVDPEYKGE